MLSASFLSSATQIGGEQCLFSKLKCSLGSWFPSAAGMAPETTAPKAHAQSSSARLHPAPLLGHPIALCGQDLQSQLPDGSIWTFEIS